MATPTPHESVTKACFVEASEGDVVVERGIARTSLVPDVARDAARRMIAEADEADRQRIVGTVADQIGGMSDAELLRAYQRTAGKPGDEEAGVLLGEINGRGLNV